MVTPAPSVGWASLLSAGAPGVRSWRREVARIRVPTLRLPLTPAAAPEGDPLTPRRNH